MIWLAVAVAGAAGAAARYVVDHAIGARLAGVFPWGTSVVNVTGSLAAGVLAGLVAGHTLPEAVGTVVAGGFLGAYTTFSTAMYETVRLLEDGAATRAVANLVLPLVASVLAAALGWSVVGWWATV